MSTLPLHPALVHVPLGLAIAVPFVAVALAAVHWRHPLSRAPFTVLLVLQALLVAGGVAAMQLGERDAHRVERAVGEAAIESHEERAEAFVWAAGVVLAGAAALATIAPRRGSRWVAAAVAAGSLAVAGLGFRAGEAGGELVYQRGAASAWLPGADPAPAGANPRAVARDDD